MFTPRQLVTRSTVFVPKGRTLIRSLTGYPILSHAKQQYSRPNSKLLVLSSCIALSACLTSYNDNVNSKAEANLEIPDSEDETTDVINWSGTHKVTVNNNNLFEPETVEDVEAIIKDCNNRKQTVRPLGSSLSPNGIALNEDGMMSMANLDRVLQIDPEKKTVTVQAGITVQRVRKTSRIFVCNIFKCSP